MHCYYCTISLALSSTLEKIVFKNGISTMPSMCILSHTLPLQTLIDKAASSVRPTVNALSKKDITSTNM